MDFNETHRALRPGWVEDWRVVRDLACPIGENSSSPTPLFADAARIEVGMSFTGGGQHPKSAPNAAITKGRTRKMSCASRELPQVRIAPKSGSPWGALRLPFGGGCGYIRASFRKDEQIPGSATVDLEVADFMHSHIRLSRGVLYGLPGNPWLRASTVSLGDQI